MKSQPDRYKENEVWCNGRGGASTDINLSSNIENTQIQEQIHEC